jgi:predicted MPP superfamily phosphohydrolase
MKITRRHWLRAALYGTPVALAVNAFGLEPNWLRVRTMRMTEGKPALRLLQFTDVHFKGDTDFLESVVSRINALSPDVVCFTGDLIEEGDWLQPALEIIAEIKAPMFGIPGNHDHWSGANFAPIKECFQKTGGQWLMNERVDLPKLGLNIIGVDRMPAAFPSVADRKNIMLVHYPEWADKLGEARYDLVLAGHTHGGQVRVPFYGPLIVPFSTGRYDMGRFETKAGPLYVNPGIGSFYLDVRFNCRPELTVFEF